MRVPDSGLRFDNPAMPLLKAAISYQDVTTAAGNAAGTTFVCTGLASEPSYQDHFVKILSGPAAGQMRYITVHAGGSNTGTVDTAFLDMAGAAVQITTGTLFVILSQYGAGMLGLANSVPRMQEIVIYPVLPSATPVITDDGASPAYAALNTTTVAVGAPAVAWSRSINFEQQGSIEVTSIYVELEWQSQFVVNGGVGTDSNSKVQISGDGGATWTDLTDLYTHSFAALTTRIRQGAGQQIAAIVTGVNQLQFRLIHWVGASDGVSQSVARMRTRSYVRLTYRKY